MTPPLCLWCQKEPVGRVRGQAAKKCHRKGWRNYCSRRCSGESAQSAITPEQRQAQTNRLTAFNRKRHVGLVIGEIRKALGDTFTDGTPVTVAQAVKLWRMAYKHGCFNTWQRIRRERIREAA